MIYALDEGSRIGIICVKGEKEHMVCLINNYSCIHVSHLKATTF